MPTYHYHVATDRNASFPPVDNLPSVDADDPMAAVTNLARDGKLATTRPTS